MHWSCNWQSLYWLLNVSQNFFFCLNYLRTKKSLSFSLNSSNETLIVFPACVNWSRWREAISYIDKKKYCAVGKWWSENHKYLFKALKIFFIEISKPIYISIFFKWNIGKGTTLSASRRIDKCSIPEQWFSDKSMLGIDWVIIYRLQELLFY